MKILLLGGDGQVGWELQRSLAAIGTVLALGRDAARNPQGLVGDLTQTDGVIASIRAVEPQVIVNAAAYTAVDKAESEPEMAARVNAHAVGVIAREAQALGTLLVHYSTDYVFDGAGSRAWSEQDATAPLNVYGKSKLEGEHAVAASACRHLILRTSWVYAARGHNFPKTMLRLAETRRSMRVVADQWGAPTGAELLADVTAHALRKPDCPTGVYHLTAAGATSWHGYAEFVLEQARQRTPPEQYQVETIQPIATAEYPTPAARPLNSRLDCRKIENVLGLHLPAWQVGIQRMLAEIL